MKEVKKSGHHGARDLLVWDPLVRLIHWSLVVAILLNATIVDDDGKLHQWIGYFAAGIVIIRIIWGIIGAKHARLTAFAPSISGAISHLKSIFQSSKVVHISHNPLGAIMVYNLWATILILAITGYMMGTVQYFGIEWVEEIHEIAFFWLLFSIGLHVAGVVFDTWRTNVPLIKSMISGRKRFPPDASIK